MASIAIGRGEGRQERRADRGDALAARAAEEAHHSAWRLRRQAWAGRGRGRGGAGDGAVSPSPRNEDRSLTHPWRNESRRSEIVPGCDIGR